MDHMIEAGLLMPDELKLMGGLSEKGSKVKVLPYTLAPQMAEDLSILFPKS